MPISPIYDGDLIDETMPAGVGLSKPASMWIPVTMGNPHLPKMEFNTVAKAKTTWYRPTTKAQVYNAIVEGIVVQEDEFEDDEGGPVITWNPLKYTKTITEKRLQQLRICPDKKYMVMRLARWVEASHIYVGWVTRPNAQDLDFFAAIKGSLFKGWVEPAKFVVLQKDETYV